MFDRTNEFVIGISSLVFETVIRFADFYTFHREVMKTVIRLLITNEHIDQVFKSHALQITSKIFFHTS